MDKINIEGVILTPLKKISHPKGDIFHGIKKSDDGFVGFGEAYFTTINKGQIKGWNRHMKMTLNLVVPVGSVQFVIYDDRHGIDTKSNFFEVELSPDNYKRMTIPPGLWVAFKGKSDETNLILNMSDLEHDPDELEKLNVDQIEYDWNSV